MDLSRVILYCIVCSDTSGEYVHKYIGKEPSGGSAEALTLKDGMYFSSPLISFVSFLESHDITFLAPVLT